MRKYDQTLCLLGASQLDDQRFDRMEKHLDKLGDKVDDLTKVVTDLARMEERMITLFKRMDRYDATCGELDDRLTEVEEVTIKRGVVYQAMEKGFWLVVGAGLTWIVKVAGSA